MKYSNSAAETEIDKLRQNIISTIDKEIANLQSQVDKINAKSTGGGGDITTLNSAIETFIKSHPEIVASTLENFYKQKTLEAQHQSINQGIETIINDIKSGALTTFAGKADAPIKVIEFFDYSCGYCVRMLETNSKLLEQNPDTNMIFIELPILGAESVEATRFATAISMIDQSKYLQFQIQLLNSKSPKNRDNMMQIASNTGIDVAKLQSFMENRSSMDKIEERIKQNSIIANNMHLQGTPTYIIDDEILVGAVSQDKINDAIAKAREKIQNINNNSDDKK